MGSTPPPGLPEPLIDALRHAEHEVSEGEWTLTWLEDRPVVEHDTGVRLALGADGRVHDDDTDLGEALQADDEDAEDLFPDR